MPLPKLPDGKWVNSDPEKGDVFTTYLRNVFQLISPRDYVSLFRPHQARSMSGYWVGAKVIELFNTKEMRNITSISFRKCHSFSRVGFGGAFTFPCKTFQNQRSGKLRRNRD